ncbi:MAG: hypothetical protein AB2L18_02665 [Anaerolineaceae bacterium]
MLQENDTRIKPPRIIQTLVQGFNLIAAHPYIMLFPLFLDLFFWFGPFYRIKELLSPALDEMMQTFSTSLTGADVASTMEAVRTTWEQLLTNFNLFTGLRTVPIGIPSLLASKGYTANPIGNPLLVEMGSSSDASLLMIFCVVLGLFLGGIYYALISRLVLKNQENDKSTNIIYSVGQTFVLFFLIIVVILLLTFPILCFLSSFSVLIPTMGTLPLLILGIVLMWILLPFVFSPHGIFTRQLSAFKAIMLSTKFVRVSSLATTLFLTLAVSLSYGLDLLWSTPTPDSWLYFLGIIGHAFVSSGILAASFIYFRDGTNWMEEIAKLSPQNITRTNI